MKIVKGTAWLKRDFLEQLEKLLEDNHVVELDNLVKFDGKEQLIKNMLIRMEIKIATGVDIEKQKELDRTMKKAALKDKRHQDKLKKEEEDLRGVMGL